jgi:ribosomal-protein-alanine N-acetyltransferase
MIRRVTLADVPFLVKVEELSFNVPWPDFLFKAHLNNPGFVVYEREGNILGYAMVGDSKGRAQLYGYRVMVLEVRQKNTSSQAFYTSHSFKKSGTVAGYYLDDDAIIMTRKI